jgi:hypothetical protein
MVGCNKFFRGAMPRPVGVGSRRPRSEGRATSVETGKLCVKHRREAVDRVSAPPVL